MDSRHCRSSFCISPYDCYLNLKLSILACQYSFNIVVIVMEQYGMSQLSAYQMVIYLVLSHQQQLLVLQIVISNLELISLVFDLQQ